MRSAHSCYLAHLARRGETKESIAHTNKKHTEQTSPRNEPKPSTTYRTLSVDCVSSDSIRTNSSSIGLVPSATATWAFSTPPIFRPLQLHRAINRRIPRWREETSCSVQKQTACEKNDASSALPSLETWTPTCRTSPSTSPAEHKEGKPLRGGGAFRESTYGDMIRPRWSKTSSNNNAAETRRPTKNLSDDHREPHEQTTRQTPRRGPSDTQKGTTRNGQTHLRAGEKGRVEGRQGAPYAARLHPPQQRQHLRGTRRELC